MFVIEVIPLKRGMHVESLSYFSSISYEAGTILTIPLRSKETQGVVISSEPVSATKAALRAATFSLRKLPAQTQTRTLSPALIKTAHELAEYYACQPGAALYELLPPEVRTGAVPIPPTRPEDAGDVMPPEVLQDTLEERYVVYRSLVREALARGTSLLFVVPSPVEADTAHARLSSGIEEHTIMLTSVLGAQARRRSFEAIGDFSKPKCIITTSSYAVLERHDIATVILESEGSANYRTRTRPYFDYRVVLRTHARHTGRRLIFGDLLIRTEEEYLRREETYETYGETPKRFALSGKLTVVRMKETPQPPVPFQLFAESVLDEITATHTAKGRTFLFAARRGLAPVIACMDCGYIFRSPESGAPYSLIRTTKNGKEERYFVCTVSGQKVRAADVCESCGSWRLRGRGIGIQHVYDELSTALPGIPLIVFDHTSANTYKKASFLQKKFYEAKGAVMLGTPMALPYLTDPIDTSVIVSQDALRATPTWHQEEMTLATLLALRERTTGTLYVQTRMEEKEKDPFIEYARTGTLEKFYDEEIELRQQFNYPPFAHFVHLTWQEKVGATADTTTIVGTTLERFNAQYYAAPLPHKGAALKHALIRIPRKQWPKKDLVAALRMLPPSVRVVMNPDRIV